MALLPVHSSRFGGLREPLRKYETPGQVYDTLSRFYKMMANGSQFDLP
jgi:hypothetical protein